MDFSRQHGDLFFCVESLSLSVSESSMCLLSTYCLSPHTYCVPETLRRRRYEAPVLLRAQLARDCPRMSVDMFSVPIVG